MKQETVAFLFVKTDYTTIQQIKDVWNALICLITAEIVMLLLALNALMAIIIILKLVLLILNVWQIVLKDSNPFIKIQPQIKNFVNLVLKIVAYVKMMFA